MEARARKGVIVLTHSALYKRPHMNEEVIKSIASCEYSVFLCPHSCSNPLITHFFVAFLLEHNHSYSPFKILVP